MAEKTENLEQLQQISIPFILTGSDNTNVLTYLGIILALHCNATHCISHRISVCLSHADIVSKNECRMMPSSQLGSTNLFFGNVTFINIIASYHP